MVKTTIRREMLAARQALSAGEKSAAAERFIASLSCLLSKALGALDGQVIAVYVSHHGELDLLPAMEALAPQGCTFALPCVQKNSKVLTFRAWQPGDALVEGAYGIKEPSAVAPMVVPNILCVPLIAADKQRNRLGYGGGYYDATIEHFKQSAAELVAIGIAYDMQLLDTVPDEPHDQPLDYICTPSKWF